MFTWFFGEGEFQSYILKKYSIGNLIHYQNKKCHEFKFMAFFIYVKQKKFIFKVNPKPN
jgi:hypothetical protein